MAPTGTGLQVQGKTENGPTVVRSCVRSLAVQLQRSGTATHFTGCTLCFFAPLLRILAKAEGDWANLGDFFGDIWGEIFIGSCRLGAFGAVVRSF